MGGLSAQWTANHFPANMTQNTKYESCFDLDGKRSVLFFNLFNPVTYVQ